MRSRQITNSDDAPDIQGIVSQVFRHFWWFIIPLLAAAAIVVVVGKRLPPKYQGSAVVDLTTNAVLTKTMREALTPDFEVRKDSIAELVMTEEALDRVMADLRGWLGTGGLDEPIDFDQLRETLKRKVVVTHRHIDSNHDRIEISYTHNNSQLIGRVVNRLAQLFIEKARLEIDGGFTRAVSFIEEELQRSRTEFRDLDDERLAFEVKHGEVLGTDAATLRGMIAAKVEQKNTAEFRLNSANARAQALQAELSVTPDTVQVVSEIKNPELPIVEENLRSLRLLLAKSLGELGMRERHPDVINLRKAIAEAEDRHRAIVGRLQVHSEVPNPEKLRLIAELKEAIQSRSALQAQAPDYDGQIEALNRRLAMQIPALVEHRDILGKVDAARRKVEFWEESRRRSQLMMVAEHTENGIQLALSRACPPVLPPVPTPMLTLVASALVVGTMFGGIVLRLRIAIANRYEAYERMASGFNIGVEQDPDEAMAHAARAAGYASAGHRRIFGRVAAAVLALCVIGAAFMFYKGKGPASVMATSPKSNVEEKQKEEEKVPAKVEEIDPAKQDQPEPDDAAEESSEETPKRTPRR